MDRDPFSTAQWRFPRTTRCGPGIPAGRAGIRLARRPPPADPDGPRKAATARKKKDM